MSNSSTSNIVEKMRVDADEDSDVLIVDSANEASEEPRKKEVPKVSVDEKVIFCVDALLINTLNSEPSLNTIVNLLFNYMTLKKQIAVKQVQFSCFLMLNNDIIMHTPVNQKKDLMLALSPIKDFGISLEETEACDFDYLFKKIAELVELPDYDYYGESIPPPFVYHAILLFSHNTTIPTMKSTNAYDFLMGNPYFAFDVLYLYELVKGNLCEVIMKVLTCLNENGNGYYLSCSKFDGAKRLTCMAQFLGHPLMRFPQHKAKFNVLELGEEEVVDYKTSQ